MAKKAFNGIMAGLQDALAYVQGDTSRATRVVTAQPTTIKSVCKKKGSRTLNSSAENHKAALRALR